MGVTNPATCVPNQRMDRAQEDIERQEAVAREVNAKKKKVRSADLQDVVADIRTVYTVYS